MNIRMSSELVNPSGSVGFREGLNSESRQEFEQGVVRLLLGLIFSCYQFSLLISSNDIQAQTIHMVASLGYVLFSALLLSSFKIYPGPSVTRKVITLITDYTIVLCGLYLLGESGMPLYAVLFLLTISYATSFGFSDGFSRVIQ